MTVDTDSTELSLRLKRAREAALTEAYKAIGGLAAEADALGLSETSASLLRHQESLAADTFKVIVMGRFKNGKSVLLNALLGGTTHPVNLEGHPGPMVSDELPCTARLTEVVYAEQPYVKAWYADRHFECWDLSRYLNESTLGVDEQESQGRLGEIRQFEIGFPAVLCQAGVTIFDSPGLDDIPPRTAYTRDATKRCDAAIVVYRSDAQMGQKELEEAAQVVSEGTRVFTVINLMDGKRIDDRLRAFTWNRYVKDHLHRGESWSGQDLSLYDIYFIDALKARNARYARGEGVEQSGLTAFESRLGSFLMAERQQAHLQKFTTAASQLSSEIDEHIAKRKAAAVADRAHLLAAYAAAQPELEALRNRPAKLPNLFERYRDEAQLALTAGFDEMVARTRRDLPVHLAATELPSAPKSLGDQVKQVFIQKRLQEEAVTAVSNYISTQVQRWCECEVPLLLKPILERLGDDIAAEIAAIGCSFDEINFELTGWTHKPDSSRPMVGMAERVLSAVAGLFFGDLSAAIGGGAGGWRGALGGISGAVGSTMVLVAIGAVTSVVFLPVTLLAAMVAATFAGGHKLQERVKNHVIAQTDEHVRDLPTTIKPRLLAELDEEFAKIESAVTNEIVAAISEEQRALETLVELNERDQAERERILVKLAGVADRVRDHRERLNQALLTARQS